MRGLTTRVALAALVVAAWVLAAPAALAQPAAPTIAEIEGDATSPALGNDTTPTIVVSGVVEGDTVRVLEGTAELAAKVVAPGATSVTFNAAETETELTVTGDGDHSLTATSTDPLGSLSQPSAAFVYTLDTTGPGAPTIVEVEGDATSPAAGNDVTPTVVVSGVVEGDTVRVVEGTTVLATKVVAPGATSVTFNAAETDTEVTVTGDGDHSLTATSTDPAGNASGPSAAFVYTLDVTAPDAPTIAEVEGDATSPALGTDTTPTIVVSGVVAGDTVRVLEGTTVLATKVVLAGVTSVTFNAAETDTEVTVTGDGDHSLTATSTDLLANVSAPSAAFVYTLDTTPPAAPTVSSVEGDTTAPALGNDATPTVVVSGVAGDTIRVLEGTTELAAKIVAEGATSVTFNAAETDTEVTLTGDGEHSLTATATDPLGQVSDPSAAFVYTLNYLAGTYHPLTPSRILDTRTGTGASGKVGPAGKVSLQATGRGGVPASGVVAVVMNVTVTEATAPSYLTVYPSGGEPPTASNLNFVGGQDVPNLVKVKVGSDGKVDLYNAAGATHVVGDVVGWYGDGSVGGGARHHALPPARVLDTRDSGAKVGPGATHVLQVTEKGGVPATGVSAVVMNVTVTEATAPSYLTVFPGGVDAPTASNLNFVPGRDIPNLVVVKVGPSGEVNLYNAAGSTHVVADVVGWYGDEVAPTGALYTALPPDRILDTRSGNGGSGKVGPTGDLTLQVAGRGGVPATGVSAVVMNVTVTEATAPSFLTVYPGGMERPTASNLNFVPGRDIPNLVLVKVGPDGEVKVHNAAGGTHVVADVVGWLTAE